ncbi:putative membrane protein [Bacteriovorax sp. BAL6_X]|uniref:trimeric intracellular cation channel family protein n=1 Tax=Bacteriovorax sp. BAL6_X TaxID=1201290 RepID=UPI000386E3CE|nr:trimeric intracellular cation channel family protein [Bacteriovorax sp. BAL6_X]EPZ49248.1 putative membrane protein [Bacteriovorax sp. BAL6_X]
MNEFIYFDYLGTFAFAVTGASVGGKSKLDLFGMLFLAFLTAVGGGTVRDLIIDEPVFWTQNTTYLYIIIFSTLSIFFMRKFYERQSSLLLFLDTLGLGFFVVIGTQKTLLLGFNNETSLLMGVITAVLGGILRSAFSGELSILYQKELYATVAAISSLVFILMSDVDLEPIYPAITVIVTTFILRYGAIKLGLKLPTMKE